MSPRSTPQLLVFARAPLEDAQAKPLGVDATRAAAVYEAMLTRTLAAARAVPGVSVRLVTTEALDLAALRGVDCEPQRGASLPKRVEHAISAAFDRGHAAVLCLAADTPGLDTATLRRAVQALAGPRPCAVLGPSSDGGYYLVGTNATPAGAFAGVATGTSRTAVNTCAALGERGFELVTLAPLDDIDRCADLRRLVRGATLELRLFLAGLVALIDGPSVRRCSTPLFHIEQRPSSHAARGPPAV